MMSALGSVVNPGIRAHVSRVSGLVWATMSPSSQETSSRGSSLAFHGGQLQSLSLWFQTHRLGVLVAAPSTPLPRQRSTVASVLLPTEHARRWAADAECSRRNPRHTGSLRMTPFPSSPRPWGDTLSWGRWGALPAWRLCLARPGLPQASERRRPRQPAREGAGFALEESRKGARTTQRSVPQDDECLWVGCPCFPHRSQDTCKSPVRALIYKAGTQPAESRILLCFLWARAGACPSRPCGSSISGWSWLADRVCSPSVPRGQAEERLIWLFPFSS